MADLISRTTRGMFRDLMTNSTWGRISAAFQDEGFAPNPDCTYEDSSVRRQRTQSYLEGIDWRSPDQVGRALRVFERLLHDFRDQETQQLRDSLTRDGCIVDPFTGRITAPEPSGPYFREESLSGLTDPAAIRDHLDRIQRSIGGDPAAAIGSAKELIESTAKLVLTARGHPFSDRDDLPKLVNRTQQALALNPSSATPGPDGTDAIRRILGGVSNIAAGVAELRNRGYGTGHGPAAPRRGLGERHANLAVNAACNDAWLVRRGVIWSALREHRRGPCFVAMRREAGWRWPTVRNRPCRARRRRTRNPPRRPGRPR